MEVNKIYLGDAYELIKQVPDKSVDLVYTDIPYEGGFNKGNINGAGFRESTVKLAENVDPFFHGIDMSIFGEMARVCKKLNIYCWMSFSQVHAAMTEIMRVKPNAFFKMLVWCKPNVQMMNFHQFRTDVEYCLVATDGQGLPNADKEFPSKFVVANTNSAENALYQHPTVKPSSIVAKHIRLATRSGDLVLDPFCGSGSTCACAKDDGRDFIGFELDEKYFKIACDRIAGLTPRDKETGFIQETLF